MALVVGTNSYISVANADTYFSERLNVSDWTGAVTATKEAALIQATRTLDALYTFAGDLTSDDQALAWPRSYVYDCEGRELDSATIPEAVKNATCEEALHLLAGDQISTPSLLTQGFKKAKLGSMEVEVSDSKSGASPDKISGMARDYLACIGTPKSGAISGGGFAGSTMRA